jgi:hypothetical protein
MGSGYYGLWLYVTSLPGLPMGFRAIETAGLLLSVLSLCLSRHMYPVIDHPLCNRYHPVNSPLVLRPGRDLKNSRRRAHIVRR